MYSVIVYSTFSECCMVYYTKSVYSCGKRQDTLPENEQHEDKISDCTAFVWSRNLCRYCLVVFVVVLKSSSSLWNYVHGLFSNVGRKKY